MSINDRYLGEYPSAHDRVPSIKAERQQAYRDRLRGAPPRVLAPCGTLAAFRRHQRHGEPICEACRQAYNAAHREMYAKRCK